MKHSLANSSAELGLEECPSDQESDTARQAHMDISKPYHSPSTSMVQSASCDADLSEDEEIVAYQLGSSLAERTHYGDIETDRRTRKSETVVSILYVSLSDQARGGGGMISPPHPISSYVLSNNGVSVMDKSHENDNTMVSRDSGVEGCARSDEQRAPRVYGLRNRRGKSIELTARQIVERKLRNKGKAFRPLLPDIEEESLRSAWKHAYMSREQELGGRCGNSKIHEVLEQDAVVRVPGSEAVRLTAHRTSLSGEFSESNNVGSTQYSAEFSGPLKIREFHIKHESGAPASEDKRSKRARKLMAQDAVVTAPDSETVVPIRYVFLSDEAYVGGMISPLPSFGATCYGMYGISSMNKLPKDRYDTYARKLLGQDAIVPVPGSQAVYLTGYTSAPESKVHSGGLESTGIEEGQVLGSAVNYHKPKTLAPHTRTVSFESNAPIADGRDGFDEGDTAVQQQPHPEAAAFANHVSRVSSRSQESVSAEKMKQVSGAEKEAYNDLPSYVPHIQTTILKGGNVSNVDQLAGAKKAATKRYARKLLKQTLIAGSDSEDVTLTGYVSLSEKISSSSYGSSAKKEETQVLAMRGVPAEHNKQRSDTHHAQTIMLKNDVNSMLPNENDDDQAAAPPFAGRALTPEEIPTRRRQGMMLIDGVLSVQTPSSAIRRLEFEEVRTGNAAMKDIYRSFLHIYGVHDDGLCISSVNFLTGMGNAPQVPDTLSTSSLDQYPSDELCDLLNMTREEYKSNLDTSGYRAITATVLKELIRSAADKKGKSVTDIHPVLIEELVTTLSQACICGFPSLEVQLSGINLFSACPPEDRHLSLKPVTMDADRGLHVDFKSENELSVYSHFYPLPWLGGYVATHVWYDVSVSPDTGQLHYKNFVVRIAFPGVDKVFPEQKLCSKIDVDLTSAEEVTIFHSLPSKMPVVGFMLEWDLPDESIPIVDMLSVRPAKTTTIRDSVELTRKRLSGGALPSTEREEASESEVSIEGQEGGTREFTVISFIKSVLMRLCGLVIDYFLRVMKFIGDLLSDCYKPMATHTDEKESCPMEREAVEAVSISVSDRKEDIDLAAELPKEKAKPLSVDDDTMKKASTKKTHVRRRREARNAASTHLGDVDATKTDVEKHARVGRKRSKSVTAAYKVPTLCPDSYLSDSSIDEFSRRSRNL